MDAAAGRQADAVAFFAALAEATHEFDFYQTLRHIECLYADRPRWGHAELPVDEPVRLGQDPDLAFAPAPLASFVARAGQPPRLHVRLFGLLGPNGPMPLHVTEYARERLRNVNDPTFSRFLDVLNHRFLALFYRAWAAAQPHLNHDRPEDDRFADYLGALIGLMPHTVRHRDAVHDTNKLFHVGTLARHVRNAEGLEQILRQSLHVPVRVEEFVTHWMPLGPAEWTALAGDGALLGRGAVLGRHVWDAQHKVRVHLGPLTLAEYEKFLPDGAMLEKLVDWVRFYLSFELDWDARVVLAMDEVPRLQLARQGRLGWTTWLGERDAPTDADDLCLHPETYRSRRGASAA